jgi:hypothetical protein
LSLLDAWDRAVETIDPTPDPYQHNAVKWTREKRGAFLWSKQREVARSVSENRFTACHSAHGTGKSWLAADIVAWWMDVHPIGDAFAVTTAPTAAQVDAILWREIGKAHREMGLEGRIIGAPYPAWKVGDELIAYGRKPSDYADPTKAMQSFQGIHAKYVLVVLDEATGIPKWLWDAVDTLVTNEHSRVLAIGNPDDPASQFANICLPGSGWNVIGISAFDLPWATGEDVPDYLHDVLTGETWVKERAKRWGENSPLYVSKVLGEFPEVADDTLISPKLIRDARENVLDGLDPGQFGGDVARKGRDETVVYRNRGGVIRLVKRLPNQDTMATAGAFALILREAGNAVPMFVDMIGIGAGVYDRLKEQNLWVVGFDAGGQAYDPTRFVNRRAEAYWELREGFEEGNIDLDELDDDLAAQLQSIKWKTDSRGRKLIESKDDMKKRGLPSPDRADAAMMAFATPPYTPLPDATNRVPGLTDDLLDKKM